MNVAEFILKITCSFGTDTGFCLTGGMAMHINRAAAESSSLNMIYCNHEQAVAAAADGYAKAKEFQVPGIAIVTSGPGVTNTITSVASAYYDSVPMFILAGQVKRADINQFDVRSRGAQETPQVELLSSVTKKAFRYEPETISDEVLAEFLSHAICGRKGPVFVEIPLDVQSQLVENAEHRIEAVVSKMKAIAEKSKTVPEAALEQVVRAISSAKRPVCVLGNALRIAGVERAALLQLLEKLKIPALFTWASFDLVEHSHPLNFGCAGGLAPTHSNKILQSADFVLFLGTRLDLLTTAFNPDNYGKNAKRIVIELDENEIKKNNHLSNTTFLQEDVSGVVSGLLSKAFSLDTDSTWLPYCESLREDDQKQESAAFEDSRLTTYQIAKILSASTAGHYVVPTASGYATEGIARFYKPVRGATFAWAGHVLGSMGLGLPAAIGAVAALKSQVVCLEGDGGILLNVQELFTLAANPHLPLAVVVMNNGGYQSIIKSQMRAFNSEFGASARTGLFKLDFEKLAESAALGYVKCQTQSELVSAFEQLARSPRCLIEVIVEEDGYRGPAVVTKFDKDGKPYSTDIGEVNWERSN